MTPDPETAELDRAEHTAVLSWCTALDLGPPSQVRPLRAGQSGSLVVALVVADHPAVLKITTDPARLARAASELRLIAEAGDGLADLVPNYLAGRHDHDRVGLLTAEHRTMPPPAEVSVADWTALATALAGLHETPVPAVPRLCTRTAPDPAAIADGVDQWSRMGLPEVGRRAAERLLTLTDAAAWVDPGLMHGDCHLENVVRDEDGRFRWIDWQEAQLGDGLGDLVFLWHRAEFAGANPPRAAMIDAYAARRNRRADSAFVDALDRAELRLLLLAWPPFMQYGSAPNQLRMKQRLADLADNR